MERGHSFDYYWSVMETKSILVVEDEASIAEVVSLYLKRAGYHVQIASDGRKAMNVLKGNLLTL